MKFGGFGEDIAEPGHSLHGLRREVGAPKERELFIGRQEHRQWPAAGSLHDELVRRLVDPVKIWTLFLVDFDIDEMSVHQIGDRFVFETLVRHNVTPMTRRVADRKQYRFVFSFGYLQRLRAPWPPVHRVVFVLLKIEAGFFGQSVHIGSPNQCGGTITQ